ncbi:MAG: hypothetical protein H0W24_00960 [Lysobacter sp.]|nr:hypothetical protein [Lysobacter sp.]MDQ3269295.1 hypothetical protein [Pseudomonadota bacterium]
MSIRTASIRAAATLAMAAAFTLSACQPEPDPAEIRAAQVAAEEADAEAMAKQFDAEFARGNWELARAHGNVLTDKYPDSAAAERIAVQHAEASTKAEAERESRRTSALWTYQTQPVDKGEQKTAAIYSREPVDVGDGAPQRVRLIFRDHPQWGRSSYLVLTSGDFDCYGGCKVQVKVDDATPRAMDASRPKTDEAIAMFIEDERALWRLVGDAEMVSIEFPAKAGGRRTAQFEVAGLDDARLPGWK